ncbi:MAG: DUF58 domain-containing protein [Deltaproteobacteria bacterium]|nr:DUF58 domain-containing protein [Deltaproteobacteria bacterium]
MQIQEERLASIFFVPLVQVFVGVFLFIALLYGFRELALFTGILLGIGIGAYIWCRMSPLRIGCELGVDRQRIFPGEKLKISIQVVNAKYLPVLLKIAIHFDRFITGSDREDTLFSKQCGLLWYQNSRFQKELTPRRRGLYRVGPPDLMVGDLFGFHTREKIATTSVDIVVYPRLVEVKPLSLAKREFYGIPGARSPVEDPVYIYGTRDYQPGSPARRIHWKASARHNRIQEKLCEPAEQEKVMLLLEAGLFEEARAEGKFERIIEIAASYAVWLDQQGHAVGFATNGILAGNGSLIIPIARSPVQLSVILETLARVTMRSEARLTDILSQGYVMPWGVSCLAFAYEQGEATAAIEASMRNRNIPTIFVHAQKTPGFSDDPYTGRAKSYNMDEIRIMEDRDP